MEDLKYINAEWARKTASTQLGETAKKQLETCLLKIKAEVGKNGSSTSLSSLEDITKKELESRGFKLKYYPGDPRDQREQSYYTISW
jgi:hypothetical protein